MRACLACVVVSIVSGAACASSGRLDPRLYGQSAYHVPAAYADPIEVRFLGVGGFLIRRGGEAVLTAPLHSNPRLEDVLADRLLKPRQDLIDSLLPESWVGEADAILVGHSHYDHLMDVSYVANTKARAARVYGSETMTHLLSSAVDKSRLVSVSDRVDYRMCPGLPACNGDNQGQAGDWVRVTGDPTSGRGVRVRPLCSKHSSQFAGLKALWQGCAHADRPLPSRASEWLLGDTLAYLIDFLQDGKPIFRVYYQDSATDPTFGFVREELIHERPVDVALLCAGAFNQVKHNPEEILKNTKAKYVLMGHWDDFFVPLDRPLASLPLHDLTELVKGLQKATGAQPWEGRYWFPAPGSSFLFNP